MNVYLAGRSEDAKPIATLRARLQEHGIGCTARWLDGFTENQRLGALHCLIDIAAADVVVLINLQKVHRTGTGGRHVETGIAIATGKPLIVYGERENVFHHLDAVRHVAATPGALGDLVDAIHAAAKVGAGPGLRDLHEAAAEESRS